MPQAATETIQVIKKLTAAYRRTKDEDLLDMVESLLDVLDILLQEAAGQTFAPYPVQPRVPLIPMETTVYSAPITTTGGTVSSVKIIATNHTDQDKP